MVDDEPALGEELRSRLRAAGYDAEAVSTAVGLTAEFLERLAPGLVLLDAGAGGSRTGLVRTIVRGLRERTGSRLLLMGPAGPGLARAAQEIGADGSVDKAQLFASPSAALGPASPEEDRRRPPPLPPPPAPSPEILSMIEEELARLRETEPRQPPTFHAVVDLFSDNNFYVSKTATGRLVGIFVATHLPPPVGTVVHLTVAMLGGHRFETRGEVIWTRERAAYGNRLAPGAGIRMLDLREEDKEAIRAFLRQRAPITYTGE